MKGLWVLAYDVMTDLYPGGLEILGIGSAYCCLSTVWTYGGRRIVLVCYLWK